MIAKLHGKQASMAHGTSSADGGADRLFSPDYFTARRRFQAAAADAGFTIESHAVRAPGPGGEELTIDVASSGDAQTSRGTVVVSSGLHGVEGFLGSAVQLAILTKWPLPAGMPHNVAVVLIHALNPFGFAHLRRTNEENVDPNRNFLLDGQAYQGSPEGYQLLDAYLNPKQPPSLRNALLFYAKAFQAIRQHELRIIGQAVAGGQYENPLGLFYGGTQPGETVRILRDHLARWIGPSPRTLHLDLHTGLGRWAECTLWLDEELGQEQIDWLSRRLGKYGIIHADSHETVYRTSGSLGRWCRAQLHACDYTCVCVEFGTYRPLRMLTGLRAENQAFHWGHPTTRSTIRARRRLNELFCPASSVWRRQSLEHGIDLIVHAIQALSP